MRSDSSCWECKGSVSCITSRQGSQVLFFAESYGLHFGHDSPLPLGIVVDLRHYKKLSLKRAASVRYICLFFDLWKDFCIAETDNHYGNNTSFIPFYDPFEINEIVFNDTPIYWYPYWLSEVMIKDKVENEFDHVGSSDDQIHVDRQNLMALTNRAYLHLGRYPVVNGNIWRSQCIWPTTSALWPWVCRWCKATEVEEDCNGGRREESLCGFTDA